MKALLYLVLMLGSLLGGTSQVLASDVLSAEELLDGQQGDDRCLNEHVLLPDLTALSNDNNEPKLLAAESAIGCLLQSAPVEFSPSNVLADATASHYPIRAPPYLVL